MKRLRRHAAVRSIWRHVRQALRRWHQYDRRYGWRWRAANLAAAGLMLLSVVLPTVVPLLERLNRQAYQLSDATIKLVGPAGELAQKLQYNADTHVYEFNQAATQTDNPLAQAKAQTGGSTADDKQLYGLDIHKDMSRGITYHDVNSGLSFGMTPQFTSRTGQVSSQRLVYPLGHGTQAIYTLKNNGLKEDIVVQKASGDSMQFSYTLQLPKTLEARMLGDGSVGIYSADPTLFANMSYGSDHDKQLVETARENAEKTTLVFGLPAPTIVTSKGDTVGSARAHFQLKGNSLSVVAEGLSSLHKPFSIDPSVVITSASDFATQGNNEGNIAWGSADIGRGTLNGGSSSTWGTTTSFVTNTTLHTSVAYNGYMYILGGYSGGGAYNTVRYAPINSNGTLGTWNTTTSFTTARRNHTSVAYNGYMYIIGGYNGSNLNSVEYAPINSNGTLGTWNTTTSFTTARHNHNSVVYNGYLYVIGGWNSTTYYNDVQYARVNPNGTLGTWNTTTSFTTGRYSHTSVAYNGYLYIVGGYTGSSNLNSVEYAVINADGTLGTWNTTTSFTTGRNGHTSVVDRGYLYVIGGWNNTTHYNDVQYAAINADGTIGTWNTTTSFTTARRSHASVVYNGYLYITGGRDNSSFFNDVQYSPIDPAGVLRPYTTSGNNFTGGRFRHGAAAYNGYLYIVGGNNGGPVDTTAYAPINSDGSIGTWTAGTTMPATRFENGVVAYNGYLYSIGGAGAGGLSKSEAYRAPINSDGSLGTWGSAGNDLPVIKRGISNATILRGNRIYVVGGYSTTQDNTVFYASIASDGTIGSWTEDTDSPFTNGRWLHGAVIVGNYLYVMGGFTSGTTLLSDIQYAPINSDGSLGSFSATIDLPSSTTRREFGVWADRGYIYISGGCTTGGSLNSCTSTLSDTQVAKVNSDGTLGAWTATQSFSTARCGHRAIAYDGYVLMTGGATGSNCATYQTDTQYAQINNGGSGDVLGAWNSSSSALSPARQIFSAIAYNGNMYILGGNDGFGDITGDNAMIYAPIGSDGVLSGWATVGNSPPVQPGAAYTISGGYVYMLGGGGTGTGNSVQTTKYAAVCSGTNTTVQFGSNQSITDTGDCTTSSTPGTFSSWNTGTNLVTGRYGFGVAASGGYLYAFGGCSSRGGIPTVCNGIANTVEVAQLNSTTGAPGTWSTLSGGAFTTARFDHTVVDYNGYVYVAGGCSVASGGGACSTYQNDVQFAKFNSGGTLAANAGCGATWCQTSSLLAGVRMHAATAYNGYLYITGGQSAGSQTNTVYMAAIGQSGNLGPWTKATTSFATGRYHHGSAAANGRLYVLGGDNGGTLSDVQFVGLGTIPRIGSYSKLLSFPYKIGLRSISYGGILSANGLKDVSYRVSSSGNSWTGSLLTADTLTNLRCPATATNTYLQLFIKLDDTQRGTFPDESANAANLTDITLSYEYARTPVQRLRLGKTLIENYGQSDLDICKLQS